MRKPAFIILAVLSAALLLGFSPEAAERSGQAGAWIEIGPAGGNISGLARDAKAAAAYYALTYSSPSLVFRSADSGASWTRTCVIPEYGYDLAADPKTGGLVYVLGASALFKSANKGTSFDKLAFPAGAEGLDGRMAINPANPKIIYVAGKWRDSAGKEYLSVLKSANGGQTWTLKKLDAAANWALQTGIAVSPLNPNTVYLCGYYYTNFYQTINSRIYKTSDGGATWKRISNPFINNSAFPGGLALDPKDKDRVFVATSQGVIASANGGATWKKQSSPAVFNAGSIAVEPADSKILYAQSGDYQNERGCYKSTDGGLHWKKTETGVYGNGKRILVADARIFLGSTAGILMSADGAASFNPSHDGINASNINAFGLVPSSARTIYTDARTYGCFRTADGGSTWTRGVYFNRCETILGLAVGPTNPNQVTMLAGGTNEDDLYRSADGLQSVSNILHKEAFGFAPDPTNSNRLAAAGQIYNNYANGPWYFGIYLTANGGKSWSQIKIRTDNSSFATAVAFSPSKPNTIYTGGFSGNAMVVMHKSTDGGAKWSQLPGVFDSDPKVIAVDPADADIVYIGTWYSVYKTANGGASWTRLPGIYSADSIAINKLNPNQVFIGNSLGLFYSKNKGVSWANFSDGLIIKNINWVQLDPVARNVYVGTQGGGICKRGF